MPARALIIDDEAPAREELRHLLSSFDDVRVVGEATTAEEAELLIDSISYDLVFLDIRMPGQGGIELAQRLASRVHAPAVVFTTAFVDHAVEAFELGATDYLVKPFDEVRLERAIDRALERASTSGQPSATVPAGGQAVHERPGERPGEHPAIVRIPVQRGDRIVLVGEPRIAVAEAARGYAYLSLVALPPGHPLTGVERLLTSHSLVDLEERFSEAFVRAHRSYLVNTDLVREVVPQVGGGLLLVMGDKRRSQVPVARRQAAEVRHRLGV